MISRIFRAYGRFCAQRPWEVIISTIFITIATMSMSVFTGLNKVCGWHANCQAGQNAGQSDGMVLTFTKCLALIYIYLQFSKLRRLGSKYLLGIAGLFTVFSSLVFSTVVVNLIGNNLAGLNEALPFFLLLIDLSRASALARFAMSSKSQTEVEENIGHGMAELGPAITLDCMVEGLVTAVGSLSGVPQLQTICCFGCLSILANYCAFMSFYPASLALVLEISRGKSDSEPVWQLNDEVKSCPVEELKPNPVTQRVKMIMSAGLLLVHIHRRFIADQGAAIKFTDDYTTGEYSLSPHILATSGLRDDVTVWHIFWHSNLGARVDAIITLLLTTVLVIKYTFYDTDREPETGGSELTVTSADCTVTSSDHTGTSSTAALSRSRGLIHGKVSSLDQIDCDVRMPTEVTEILTNMNLNDRGALFSLGDDSDNDVTVEVDHQSTQTDDVINSCDVTSGYVMDVRSKEPRTLDDCVEILKSGEDLSVLSDHEVMLLVKNKNIPSYKLEAILSHHQRGVNIRRKLISEKLSNPESMYHLPYRNYDYKYIDGACCENVIGYMPVPVGVAGPLLLDQCQYYVPMATTEGCLVASTNRGCRALSAGDGVSSNVVNDGMSRAPVVRLPSARMASQIKLWLEIDENFQAIKRTFDSTSRFARLSKVHINQAGRLLYIRFLAVTGDAMGMNMLSKGSEKAINKLQELFPEVEILSISGNFCTDKKAAAVNWIEGRGKSVVCEATISGHVVKSVLKTTVAALVDLNVNKNLIGSAMAGSIGGFNAHAANVVTAVFIACGQDAAQNVASSQCMTLMEASGEDGQDLYITCTMPCIEVGTVGGGTVLPPQLACLQMLGCHGACISHPGDNANLLARLVCATVLAGELSLMSALAAGHLVKSHLRHNRSLSNIASAASLPNSSPPESSTTPTTPSVTTTPSLTTMPLNGAGSLSTPSLSASNSSTPTFHQDHPAPTVDCPLPCLASSTPTIVGQNLHTTDHSASTMYSNTPTMNSYTTTGDSSTPTIDSATSCIDTSTCTVDTSISNVGLSTPTVGSASLTTDRNTPTIDRLTPTIDRLTPTIDMSTPITDRHTPTRDGTISPIEQQQKALVDSKPRRRSSLSPCSISEQQRDQTGLSTSLGSTADCGLNREERERSPPNIVTYAINESGLLNPSVRRVDSDANFQHGASQADPESQNVTL